VSSIKQAWARNGSDVPDMTGADLGAFVTAEVARWANVVQDTGVKVE
jgi:tripartite-type tricarboxylate transporter receptor subunit TctC